MDEGQFGPYLDGLINPNRAHIVPGYNPSCRQPPMLQLVVKLGRLRQLGENRLKTMVDSLKQEAWV